MMNHRASRSSFGRLYFFPNRATARGDLIKNAKKGKIYGNQLIFLTKYVRIQWSFMKGVFTMSKIKKHSELVSSLLYILIGALLVIFQDRTIGWAMTVMGALFIVFGILDLVRSNWGGGAVSLIIGIAILVLGWVVTEIVLLVLGVLIALKGVVALIDALRASKKDIVDIVFSILTIVIGLMLAFGNGLNVLIIIAGVMLMFNGILGLLGAAKA